MYKNFSANLLLTTPKLIKVALVFALLMLISLIMAPSARASNPQIIFSDNFNDGEADDWTVQRSMQWQFPDQPCMNQGQPAQWQVVDGRLGITISGGPGCVTEITPNHLDMTNVIDYEIEFDWYMPESTHMDRNVLMIWQDENNWYDIKVLDDKIMIQKLINGSVEPVINDTAYYHFMPDHEYHFHIVIQSNGQIIAFINGSPVINAQDQEPFLTGFKTIGLQASTGTITRSVSYFDNLVVKDLNPQGVKLEVPIFKQNDPAWKDQEYDSARLWSDKPTIQRWGCALSSLAMIFKHHGLEKMPDGAELNPASLNEWLKSQPDGYVGNGALNWLAGTRLAWKISEIYQTPKFEFERIYGSDLNMVADFINQQLEPLILQIPGHFLVADGVTNDQNLYIKDPAYSFETFGQHQTNLISSLFFHPSQTDLSYLLVAYQPELDVTITDSAGQTISNLEIFSEQLTSADQLNAEISPIVMIQQLRFPSGQYVITASQEQLAEFNLEIFTYDLAGEPTLLTQTGWLGPEPLQWTISYDLENSQVQPTHYSLAQLKTDLWSLYQSQDITTDYTYMKLDNLVDLAILANQTQQDQLLNLILDYIELCDYHFTEAGKGYLEQQISVLVNK